MVGAQIVKIFIPYVFLYSIKMKPEHTYFLIGLVFLVYRGETKRALLPNEITTIDTVKALFVRSFGRALTMEYLDSPRVKIYIHDSAKDIFYELENLSEIRDRTILKLFETDGSGRGPSGMKYFIFVKYFIVDLAAIHNYFYCSRAWTSRPSSVYTNSL